MSEHNLTLAEVQRLADETWNGAGYPERTEWIYDRYRARNDAAFRLRDLAAIVCRNIRDGSLGSKYCGEILLALMDVANRTDWDVEAEARNALDARRAHMEAE